MSSRFGKYLEGARLTRMFISQAEESLNHGNDKKALRFTVAAVREMITAMNNAASIGFNKKPKVKKVRRSRPRPPVATTQEVA